MKVLIISLPRTGSSSLQIKLCRERNLSNIFEPWDNSNRFSYNSKMKNCCVKTMIFHSPVESYLEFYKNIYKEFDEIILLSRKDLKECAESWAYLMHNNHTFGYDSTTHYIWETPPNIESHYTNITKWDIELTQLSKEFNIPITYYEDIFDSNSVDRYRKNITKNKNLI